MAIEKVKAAFRISYSIFDKIGFFLNDYMGMGVKPNKVSFRKIWFENADKDRTKWQISPVFSQSENWPFRGLFWLSKDLFEDEFVNVTEPDAMALSEIRNHLEHKYLKVHEMLIKSNPNDNPLLSFVDRMAYSIKRDDFEAKTLRILKLARAALFYLSLGMHQEEKRRRKDKDENLVMPMKLDTLDDEFKQ